MGGTIYINVGRYYAGGLRNAGDWLPTVMSDVLGVDIDIYDQQLGGGLRTNNGHAQRIGLGRINNNHYISLEGNLETARAREEQAIKDRMDISSRTAISQNQSSTNAPALGKAKDEMPSMAMNVASLKPSSASTSGNVISLNTEQMKIKAHEKASSDSSVTHSAADHQKMVSAQFIDPINTAIEKLNNFRKEMQDGHLADPEQSWRNVRKQTINQLEDQIQLKEVHAKMQELRHTITEIDREIATTHSKNQTASTVTSHSHSSSSSSSSFSVTEPTADHQAKSAPIAGFRGVVKAATRFLLPLTRKRKHSENSTPPDSPTNVSTPLRGNPPTSPGRIDSRATEEKQNSHSMERTDVSHINPDMANRFSTAQNVLDALHTTASPELQTDAITPNFDTSVTQQHSPSAVRMEEMRSRTPSPQPTNDSTAQGEKMQESNTPPA
jgi:hypothetical protein